jgi:hypothetical protein
MSRVLQKEEEEEEGEVQSQNFSKRIVFLFLFLTFVTLFVEDKNKCGSHSLDGS